MSSILPHSHLTIYIFLRFRGFLRESFSHIQIQPGLSLFARSFSKLICSVSYIRVTSFAIKVPYSLLPLHLFQSFFFSMVFLAPK